MPSESPFVSRIRAAADDAGRLPVPEQVMWEIFPFEPGSLVAKPLDESRSPEPTRHGEHGVGCSRCESPDEDAVWTNERWVITGAHDTGLPFAAMLMPRDHFDLAELNDEMAAEMGQLIVKVTRAAEGLPDVARVHVNKWGDGGAHLHVFFMGRPSGLLQLRGSNLALWEDMLPRVPPEESLHALKLVTDTLK